MTDLIVLSCKKLSDASQFSAGDMVRVASIDLKAWTVSFQTRVSLATSDLESAIAVLTQKLADANAQLKDLK